MGIVLLAVLYCKWWGQGAGAEHRGLAEADEWVEAAPRPAVAKEKKKRN